MPIFSLAIVSFNVNRNYLRILTGNISKGALEMTSELGHFDVMSQQDNALRALKEKITKGTGCTGILDLGQVELKDSLLRAPWLQLGFNEISLRLHAHRTRRAMQFARKAMELFPHRRLCMQCNFGVCDITIWNSQALPCACYLPFCAFHISVIFVCKNHEQFLRWPTIYQQISMRVLLWRI